MNHTKVTSIRMPAELAAQIDAMARAEGVSISETMRAAAYRYIATRRADHDFQQRLSKRRRRPRGLGSPSRVERPLGPLTHYHYGHHGPPTGGPTHYEPAQVFAFRA